jgi:hypothetical protein
MALSDGAKDALNVSLYWALSHRRSFKYPLGTYFPKDIKYFGEYKPKREPVPLTREELALICWAATGTNGLIRNDLPFEDGACTHTSFVGRTHPSPCNVWYNHLLFTNDDGCFVYKPSPPTKIVEMESEEDFERMVENFDRNLVKISDKRLEIPRKSPGLFKIIQRYVNTPGTTVFFPVADLSPEMANILFIFAEDERARLYDEMNDHKPAGVKKWIDNGYLNGPEVTLKYIEQLLGLSIYGICHNMQQNILLAAAAMGLGGYPFSGASFLQWMGGTPITRGFGFRFVTGWDGDPNPVGIDGIIEGHCPPYMTIDEAVEDMWNIKYKNGWYDPDMNEGNDYIFKGFDKNPYKFICPFKDSKAYLKSARIQTEESIQIAKDIANYIYDRYKRFPRGFDTMVAAHAIQIHHVDPEFYDRYLIDGATWERHRRHMELWHQG